MSEEFVDENDGVLLVHHIPEQDKAFADSESISDEESPEDEYMRNDEDINNDFDPDEFDPLREDDIFVMMEMVKSSESALCPAVTVRSCGALINHTNSPRPESPRSLCSWSRMDPVQELTGRLYRFYSPHYRHAELKRCISEIDINILRSHSWFGDFSSDEFSNCSRGSVNVSLMDSNNDSYDYIDEFFMCQMDELSEMLENMHITTSKPRRRVYRIFNLKTWTGAICQEPSSPGGQARLLPLDKAWMFEEFNGNSPNAFGKRTADWYTTDHLPDEKKRKNRMQN